MIFSKAQQGRFEMLGDFLVMIYFPVVLCFCIFIWMSNSDMQVFTSTTTMI